MSKTSTKLTAKDRVREFGSNRFHSDDGVLFCTACNKAVDHKRRQTITDHLASGKHKDMEKRRQPDGRDDDHPTKKQCTVTGLFHRQSTAELQRASVTHNFVEMLVRANIPLEKADHPAMINFLSTHVRGGGAIPRASTLRSIHLPLLIQEHEKTLHDRINCDSFVCIIADETTDVNNRPVFNILVQLLLPLDQIENELIHLPPPLLVKTVYLDKVNHATVSQALIQCCSDFQVDFKKVLLFVSDSASYMVKSWKEMLSLLWINCHHIHCFAHVLALSGNKLRTSLANLDRCVALLKNILVKAPVRRNRFLNHLRDCNIDSPTVPPSPVITRWNTWFNAVSYHAPLLQHYLEFVRREREEESDSAALSELEDLLNLPDMCFHFKFVSENCARFVATLNSWQSRKQQVHEVYNSLQDFISWLTHLASTTDNIACAFAVRAAAEKLQEYTLESKQPAIQFLRSIRSLDPTQLPALNLSCYADLKHCLHLPDNCDEEWPIYIGLANEVKHTEFNIFAFWKSVKKRVPSLASYAALLLQLPVNSGDVERSFSAYNMLYTPQRQRTTQANAEGLLKIFFNQ